MSDPIVVEVGSPETIVVVADSHEVVVNVGSVEPIVVEITEQGPVTVEVESVGPIVVEAAAVGVPGPQGPPGTSVQEVYVQQDEPAHGTTPWLLAQTDHSGDIEFLKVYAP